MVAVYGGVARCVPVTAVDVVCVACWLLAGGGPSSGVGAWSFSVVVDAVAFVGFPLLFPSTPLFGSGAAPDIPLADGDCEELVTG